MIPLIVITRGHAIVVTRLCSQGKRDTLVEDGLGRQKIVLEKTRLCSWHHEKPQAIAKVTER